jgi:hypothetical protein
MTNGRLATGAPCGAQNAGVMRKDPEIIAIKNLMLCILWYVPPALKMAMDG